MTISHSYCDLLRIGRENLQCIAIVAFGVTATTMICLLAVVGRPQERREIVSDDFTKPRPTPTPRHRGITGGGITARDLPTTLPESSPQKHYRLAASSLLNAAPLAATDNIQQLGLTLWRLRPARNTDTTERLLVRENNQSSEWIPERIEMDTPLRAGDRLRLSIESPREGYLYVIERDLSSNAKSGDGVLKFPAGANKQVGPGVLIDLPGQEDQPNFFTLQPVSGEQVAELLTIIFTTAPLDLVVGDRPLRISAAKMTKWENEWDSKSERFELVDGAGRPWTKEEKNASNATGSRQLTRNDPVPQTIYRIAPANKTGFLLNVRLSN